MATKPKTTAKRKAPVRVSKKKKRGISRLQVLVLVAVLAVIGVVAVVASQASGTPAYQYSYNKYCVAARGSSSEKEILECKNKSAEAMVYRLYKGLYGRTPDAGGYKYWTQQFAGDRTKVTQSDLVVAQVKKMGNDAAFVNSLYLNMLGRTATAKESNFWVKRIDGGKGWDRARVVVHFASSTEAIRKNQAGFTTFLTTVPVVTVVQNAANDQRKRFDAMLTDYLTPLKKNVARANTLKSQTQNLAKNTKSAADKKAPTQADLQAMQANEKTARSYLKESNKLKSDSSAKAAAADRLYDRAKVLAAYATDIANHSVYGIKKIANRSKAAEGYSSDTAKATSSTNAAISSMVTSYKVAEKKYEAGLIAIAKQATSTPTGGTCSPQECPGPAKKQGETVEQADKRWKDYCSGVPDKRIMLGAAEDGIQNSVSIVAIFDIKYINDGKHRRSCAKEFKSYDFGTLKCVNGYHPDGPGCFLNTASPAVPVPSQPGRGKQCPSNYFASDGVCWSNGSLEVPKGQSCNPTGKGFYTFYKQANRNGKISNICRVRKPQYAGY